MKVNKNIFYDVDKDKEFRFICPCNKVWNSNHRLICSTCSVKHLRLLNKKPWNLLLKRIIWCWEIYHRYWNNKNRHLEPKKNWNKTNYRRYVGQLRASKNKPREYIWMDKKKIQVNYVYPISLFYFWRNWIRVILKSMCEQRKQYLHSTPNRFWQ